MAEAQSSHNERTGSLHKRDGFLFFLFFFSTVGIEPRAEKKSIRSINSMTAEQSSFSALEKLRALSFANGVTLSVMQGTSTSRAPTKEILEGWF